ncbi:hypothetical protein HPG69_000667 [Diceros bicornis minor]|uniref:Solute carrier family 40 member n=1 Tax=Diceros bicornis minor TaxID=77932 RepID=A0A7J7FIH5_DICBM|nr:hypothetical protein HPG69_000667 [Diceros bicornis minor]
MGIRSHFGEDVRKNYIDTGIGLVVAGSVLVFGVLIGDWIDRKPRNKGSTLTYDIHNYVRAHEPALCLLLKAAIADGNDNPGWHRDLVKCCYSALNDDVAASCHLKPRGDGTSLACLVHCECPPPVLRHESERQSQDLNALQCTVACSAAVITLAALANLPSTALTIIIQRDWIVSFTGDNRGQLAGELCHRRVHRSSRVTYSAEKMNAAVQQLDQIINIFAPLSAAQVMTWASHVIGCGFILGWNLVSLLVEFLFPSSVFQLIPQLAVKPQQQTGEHFLERQQEAVNIQELPVSNYNLNILSANMHRNNCLLGWLGLGLPLHNGAGIRLHHRELCLSQGIRASLLGVLMALLALSGLMGTILLTRLRGHYGLATIAIMSNGLHPRRLSDALGVLNVNRLILLDHSSIHWTNRTVLFEGEQDTKHLESCISTILLFLGVILARIEIILSVQISLHFFECRTLFHCSISQILADSLKVGAVGRKEADSFSAKPKAKRKNLELGLDLKLKTLLSVLNIFGMKWRLETGGVNSVQCSLNYLTDLIHFMLVMLVPQPQQFGMLFFISTLFVTMELVLYFFCARKCKIINAHAQKTVKKGPLT